MIFPLVSLIFLKRSLVLPIPLFSSISHPCLHSIYLCLHFISKIWIIFIIITLNSFSGRLPVSPSFVWSGGVLPCFFICCMFLCLFILFNLLCSGPSSSSYKVIVPLTCRVCPQCVGLDQYLVKVSWLAGTGSCVLVVGAISCLSKG